MGSDGRVFNTIEELILHFKSTHDILCCKLTDACPRLINSPSVLEIDQSSLLLLERLYISEMDDIWYGIWLNDGKKIPVHIRRLSPQLNSKDNVLQETDITRRLLHDNIVQLYGISTSKVPMYIISECMNNGSLLYYLREGGGQCITYREKIYFAAQVACGIDYLNSHLCIHRYLCAKNIYLSGGNVAKIGNFMYAKILLEETSVVKLPVEQFHVRWCPPEVLEFGEFSLKSDVWSFGILASEIITNGRVPYSDIYSKDELKEMIVDEQYVIPQSQLIDCPTELYEVLCSCWRYDAWKRPQFEFIIIGMFDSIPFNGGYQSIQTLH